MDLAFAMQEYMVPLNSSVESVTLHVAVSTISTMWWQMQVAMASSMEQQQKNGLMRVRFPPR